MGYDVELVDLQQQQAAVVRGSTSADGIAEFLGSAFGEVMQVLARQGLQPSGPPFTRSHVRTTDGWELEAGFPVRGEVDAQGRVEPTSLPGGHLARTMHRGDYAEVGAAYQAVESWITEHGYVVDGTPWECYLDEPSAPTPRTQVFCPCHEAQPVPA